jgi:hypothetical protein
MSDRDRCACPKTTLRWVEHDPDFFSLMVGRIALAQISRGTSGHWFWSLNYCRGDERSAYSAPTEAEARAVAEKHARKVLA